MAFVCAFDQRIFENLFRSRKYIYGCGRVTIRSLCRYSRHPRHRLLAGLGQVDKQRGHLGNQCFPILFFTHPGNPFFSVEKFQGLEIGPPMVLPEPRHQLIERSNRFGCSVGFMRPMAGAYFCLIGVGCKRRLHLSSKGLSKFQSRLHECGVENAEPIDWSCSTHSLLAADTRKLDVTSRRINNQSIWELLNLQRAACLETNPHNFKTRQT